MYIITQFNKKYELKFISFIWINKLLIIDNILSMDNFLTPNKNGK